MRQQLELGSSEETLVPEEEVDSEVESESPSEEDDAAEVGSRPCDAHCQKCTTTSA